MFPAGEHISKRPISADLCVGRKFQSSEYAYYSFFFSGKSDWRSVTGSLRVLIMSPPHLAAHCCGAQARQFGFVPGPADFHRVDHRPFVENLINERNLFKYRIYGSKGGYNDGEVMLFFDEVFISLAKDFHAGTVDDPCFQLKTSMFEPPFEDGCFVRKPFFFEVRKVSGQNLTNI